MAEEGSVFTANVGGQDGNRTFSLTETGVRYETPKASAEIALRDVASVTLVSIGDIGTCTLRSRSGREMCVSQGDKQHAAAYRAFVVALHRQLMGSGGEVTYTTGAWIKVALILVVAALLLAVGFGMEHVIEVPRRYETKLMLVKGMALIGLVGGPLLAYWARPRPYDPRALPGDAFP